MCDCVRPNVETERKSYATADTLNLFSVGSFFLFFPRFFSLLNSNKKLYYKKFRKISFRKEFNRWRSTAPFYRYGQCVTKVYTQERNVMLLYFF